MFQDSTLDFYVPGLDQVCEQIAESQDKMKILLHEKQRKKFLI